MEPVKGMTPFGEAFNPQANGKFDTFWYETDVATIAAAGGLAQSLIQIDADSQFLWLATTYTVSIAGAVYTEETAPVPQITVQISDGGSGKYLMNAPVPLPSLAGSGRFPYRFIGPRVFQPNSTINFNWLNFSTATVYAPLKVTLHGVKAYNR